MSSVAKLLPITHLIAIWSIPVEPEAVEVKLNSCKCSFKSFLLSLFAAVLPCFREGSYQFCLNFMSRPFYLVVTGVEVPLSWPGGHRVGASCWWVLGAGCWWDKAAQDTTSCFKWYHHEPFLGLQVAPAVPCDSWSTQILFKSVALKVI